MLYFASARFLVCLSALTEIASEMGGRVMATSAVGFSSTGCLTGKVFFLFRLGGTEDPKLIVGCCYWLSCHFAATQQCLCIPAVIIGS